MRTMHRSIRTEGDNDDREDHSSMIDERSSSEAGKSSSSDSDSSSQHDERKYDTDEDEFTSSDPHEEDNEAYLKSVSFGSLVQAQQKLEPQGHKRKVPEDFDEEHKKSVAAAPQQPDKRFSRQPKVARQSKHAPTILSTKQQVSRKKDIFEPSPAVKARDPRFDPTIQSLNHDRNAVEKANKNYSFLSSYQAAEILELKAQIKKTRDPAAVAELKQRVMATENKIRAVEAKQRERDIARQHKQKEKEAIRTGEKAKPFYLKHGELKKLAQQERLDSMGAKARDKALQRKKKREKSKESKNMPRVRRE